MVRKMIAVISIGLLVIVLLTAVCYFMVSANASGRLYDDPAKTPHYRHALLPATSPVTPDGRRNSHFTNRIDAAAALFAAAKIDTLIASGGDYRTSETFGCDEPAAIRDSLAKRGVDPKRIILDYDGTRTLRSIVKAREVYGLDSVLIISQKFHNERALWLSDKEGLRAEAFNAAPSPFLKYRLKNQLREFAARVKMYLDHFRGEHPVFPENVSDKRK